MVSQNVPQNAFCCFAKQKGSFRYFAKQAVLAKRVLQNTETVILFREKLNKKRCSIQFSLISTNILIKKAQKVFIGNLLLYVLERKLSEAVFACDKWSPPTAGPQDRNPISTGQLIPPALVSAHHLKGATI
jgi:hypothetical protein